MSKIFPRTFLLSDHTPVDISGNFKIVSDVSYICRSYSKRRYFLAVSSAMLLSLPLVGEHENRAICSRFQSSFSSGKRE